MGASPAPLFKDYNIISRRYKIEVNLKGRNKPEPEIKIFSFFFQVFFQNFFRFKIFKLINSAKVQKLIKDLSFSSAVFIVLIL